MPLLHNRTRILQHVGALVETPSLYPHLTGLENLEITRRLIEGTSKDIQRALAIVQLEKDASRLVKEYSLGMKQRLALALALLGHPSLLMLDEPTNGLDPAGIQEIRELIQRLPQEYGITVFLSSHLLNEVELVATHVGIIDQGRLIFQGARSTLQAEQQSHLELKVDQPEAAHILLKQSGYRIIQTNNHGLRVSVTSEEQIATINCLLVQHGMAVYRLSRAVLSLEEIFMQLTRSSSSERSG